MACVDIHIAIYRYFQTNGIPLHFFYTYFDKTGSVKAGNLTARTKIPLEGNGFYVPDGVFKSDKALYLLEQYSDKDSKRILTSLGTHSKAIALGTPASTFNMPKTNPYILAVFTHEGIKQAVIKRLQANENFMPVSRFYFFASLDEVKKEPGTAWQTITGETLVFI
jgi:hypothetical protein